MVVYSKQEMEVAFPSGMDVSTDVQKLSVSRSLQS
jgi:hypothetical protein